jgi:uncharacterized protein YjbI with pentapeptide repeats
MDGIMPGMTRTVAPFGSLLDPRAWLRSYRARFVAAVMTVAVLLAGFAVLLWHPDWLETGSLRGLTPDQRVTAIDNARGRVIQFGAGLLAAGALVFTALNFWLSREGHVTDRYTKAIEQLGSERVDVRLGAIYALERIMIDSVRDHPTIVEVLAAFVREHSPYRPSSEDEDPDPEIAPGSPPTDVLAAVTVLGRRPQGREERGEVNLQFTYLAYANLERLNLSGVNLANAFLAGASLVQADLTGAIMIDADLSNAYLVGCEMAGANLYRAKMTKTILGGANLHGANLNRAVLTRAHLYGAKLTRAAMAEAELSRANLVEADLTATNLTRANLTDVDMTGAKLSDAVLTGANLRGAKLDFADLTGEQRASVTGSPDSGQ